ncbi:helix-turn-helix domain-containing protein [Pseudonocardia halophobica]|uniref:helix-turn-helix transcriptional regulator n=1 Tax=Pseudonocardia halophobica TaxID=29401 RepID=UPI003D8C8CA4
MASTEQRAADDSLKSSFARLDPVTAPATANPTGTRTTPRRRPSMALLVASAARPSPRLPEYEVRARLTVNTARDACLAFRDQQFDIALVHIGPAARDYVWAVDAYRRIQLTAPTCPIVLWGIGVEPWMAEAALDVGVRAVLDGPAPADLAAAVRVVRRGGVVIDVGPDCAPLSTATGPAPSGAEPMRGKKQDLLTEQQREVLRLVSQGLRNEEIAERLDVALSTVKFHIRSILTRLQAANRAEAVYLGAQLSLC